MIQSRFVVVDTIKQKVGGYVYEEGELGINVFRASTDHQGKIQFLNTDQVFLPMQHVDSADLFNEYVDLTSDAMLLNVFIEREEDAAKLKAWFISKGIKL